MKKALFVALSILLFATSLSACQSIPKGPQIEISNAWGRPSPMKAGNGAAYMLIENNGSEDDRLINAYSDIAEVTEIHDMKIEDGVMTMFHVPEGYVIAAGSSVELAPGGKHIMFISLFDQLEVGQTVTVELDFEKTGKMIVEIEIKEAE